MKRLRAGLRRAFMGRGLGELRPPPEPAAPSPAPQATTADILLQFESLGENCELGFVQSHLGTEPLGLFRWSGITLGHMVEALNTDFAGIGEPENIELTCEPTTQEYYASDRRYGMTTHTSMFAYQDDADQTVKKFSRRTLFLREKMMRDLCENAKILVFQSNGYRHAPEDLLRLHAAVRRIGPAAELLCVQVATEAEPVGSVEFMADGLMLGFIDRPGLIDGVWNISYDVWLVIMRRALELSGRSLPVETAA